MARAYRKKPVVVEAVQWTGENHAEMCDFIDPEVFEIIPRVGLVIHTLEGDHHASPGDYIIKGVNGEFYPCKPDIFAKTYESAPLTPPNEWVSRVQELDELYTKLQIATGFTAEQLLEMFAAGYTLEKPDYSKHFEAMANLAESDPPNEPLTLEQLRKMDGEPVWIVDVGPHKWYGPGWAIVDRDNCLVRTAKNWNPVFFERYGERWIAYRRPPEGEA